MTSHLAAKSGEVLTVKAPALWRCSRRSVPSAIRSNASRTTVEVVATGFRDDQPLAFAVEQLDAELRFQRLDLMAHRALRDGQFFGRAGEALVAGRGLEGLEGIQRRQAAKHDLTIHEKNSGQARETMLCGQAFLGCIDPASRRDSPMPRRILELCHVKLFSARPDLAA